MHILFLSDNFPPEVNAPASRTFEHCREWVKAGHKVTVVTCAPNFPKGKVFDGYRNRLYQSEDIEGIRVVRVWSYITANEGFAKRIADYVSFMVMAIFACPFIKKPDIVIGTSPQFFTAVAAYVVSRYKRVPYIFELRDIWPESIRAVGAMKQSRVLDWLEKLELFLYRKAACIVSVTNSFRENLVKRGIDRSKIEVITNGVDTGRFMPRSKDAELEKSFGLKGKLVAGYIGTHGMAHGLDTLLDAAKKLAADPKGKDFVFLLLGDGATKPDLKERAKHEGIENVIFVDTVGKEEVARYWSLLDYSVIHLKKNPLFTTVIPSKLFECMGMGIPVLHGVEGESADIVEKEKVGIVFEPDNADALCDVLFKLKEDTKLYNQLQQQGPIAAENYNRKNLAMRMLKIIDGTALGKA